MGDQRNLILAIVLSLIILIGFELLFSRAEPPEYPSPEQAQVPQNGQPAGSADGLQPSYDSPATSATPNLGAFSPGADPARIPIITPRLRGSLKGTRIDDLQLVDYQVTTDPDSDQVALLRPRGYSNAHYIAFGWLGQQDPGQPAVLVPDDNTPWQSDRLRLTPAQPLTLHWDNNQGLRFEITIVVDQNYMFTITQRVYNQGEHQVILHPYALIARIGEPEVLGYYILHEGPLAVFEGELNEYDYQTLREQQTIEYSSVGGWMGFTDQYWLTALIPLQTEPITARFVHRLQQGQSHYQTDMRTPVQIINPGSQSQTTTRIFAGAKEVELIDRYAQELDIERFDRSIDFGWFYFLTKPFFYILAFLNQLLGNFGLAIFAFTLLIKLLFYPLADRSYRALTKMKQLQPEVTQIRERFASDKPRMQQELMNLYQREKINPVSGCLPVLLQIPVFFALYKVLFVTIEMRHEPFIGWISDLSAPDPTTVFNLFGLLPWQPPDLLIIGGWPLIMGLTMYWQQKLNPAPPDPMQAKIFMCLPFVFTVLLAQFPAGLVIYWAWNNLLALGQQWLMMRRLTQAGKSKP